MKMRMRMVITCHTPVKTPVTTNVKLLKKCPKVQNKVKIFSTYRKMSKSSKKNQITFNFSKIVKLLKKCSKVQKKVKNFSTFRKMSNF